MKLRTWAPALIAVVGLVVVWRWMAGRNDEEPAPRAPATQVATDQTRPSALPGSPATATRSADVPALPSPAAPPVPGVAPTKPPEPLSHEEADAHLPKAKLPKLTLEERIAAAKEHIVVLQRRVELMQQEIAELEKKGDKAKADAQRIIMGRLTAHAEKLQKAIDEGRDPE
jgi:hypothetical protein